ncbi:glycosyltransferase family 4 protein [Agrococcus sp. TSP3-2-1]|uniref:glycosyltransferase family 4 protein n=1 Tax=Agrococcus sp. TSP3-2-1 TaxID=2804583 RepID=UPI003CF86C10
MKIAIVSQYYRPEPVAIPTTLAEELARRGHQVTVITGFPNYPDGRVYAGYRIRRRQVDTVSGVQVVRVPLFPDHSGRALPRMANYASFAVSSTVAMAALRSADVVYVYATQMTAALGPQLWRAVGRAPYILHVQDLWPESITGSSLVSGRASRTIDAVLTPWLRSAYRRASNIIAIAPTMASMLEGRGVDRDKLTTLLNWADESLIESRVEPIQIRGSAERLEIVYAGNLGDLQGLETAIRAMALLEQPDDAHLHLFGSGVTEPQLRELAASLDRGNVTFHGRIPAAALPRIAEQSDFQLVSLRDIPIMRGTIPSKLQASLRDGVPVIASAGGDVQRLVETHGVGFAVAPEDPAALAEAIRSAIALDELSKRAMARRARHTYETTMSFQHGVDVIERVLAAAAQEGRS